MKIKEHVFVTLCKVVPQSPCLLDQITMQLCVGYIYGGLWTVDCDCSAWFHDVLRLPFAIYLSSLLSPLKMYPIMSAHLLHIHVSSHLTSFIAFAPLYSSP